MSAGYILNLGAYANSTAITNAINAAVATASIVQMATKTGVAGDALATTALTFNAGIGLDTHIPLFYIVKLSTGTLGIAVVKLKTGVGDLTALSALVTATGANEILISPLALVTSPNTGNISVEVTTISLAASTFNVYAYGIAKP